MTRYVGFNKKMLFKIKRDVDYARKIANKCENSLIYGPKGPSPQIRRLLFDTFSIADMDWDSVDKKVMLTKLINRFSNFRKRIDNIICMFPKKPHKGTGQFAAYWYSKTPNYIYFLPAYFRITSIKERAAKIIHEFIHMVQIQQGHPGSLSNVDNAVVYFEQTSINIQFQQAFDNPYCYQYFVEWLPE